MRCAPRASIPEAPKKSSALTGLKCYLSKQARSTPFQTLTLDIHHVRALLSPESHLRNNRALAAPLNLYGIIL